MKSSPVFPKDEAGSGNAVGYNPQDDFSKFLEAARKHANDVIMNSARPSSLNSVEKYIPSESRKKKTSQKSWKNTLLFWWKLSEKKKQKKKTSDAADNDGTTLEKKKKKKRHSASGPLSSAGKERGRGVGLGGRPMSGPLSSCFTPTRTEDSTEVPYMCLEQQDYPHRVHNHGPLYKVT